MELTLKKNINTNSLVYQHNVLLQATALLMGREGVLETEKELYLILSIVDSVIEQDLIQMCNEDDRELTKIMEEDVEPFFHKILNNELSLETYEKIKKLLLNRCKEIWDNQHSVIGLIDTILTIIGTLDETGKEKMVEKSIEVAKNIEEKRTEVMSQKAEEVNDKLNELIKSYQERK